ncbi:hypothetical protein FTUN_7252 [Frigoriglobus tundricola]|uniref:Core-binding (CB) domain-containing protein n=1 Tax=Frigoriglobus tundricola TaxID=2774151 RepID=A0A6M5Z1E6_9BACT|nr:hypothetical protein FTUN_7252 [Frigoriglobus tundricola]
MLANKLLNHKKEGLDAGDLSPRTRDNYRETAELIVTHFGKGRLVSNLRADDFAGLRTHLAKNWGSVRAGDKTQETRSIFKYGYDSELFAVPVRFGPGFKRPSKKTLRLNCAETGPRMFEADELRKLIEAACGAVRGEPLRDRGGPQGAPQAQGAGPEARTLAGTCPRSRSGRSAVRRRDDDWTDRVARKTPRYLLRRVPGLVRFRRSVTHGLLALARRVGGPRRCGPPTETVTALTTVRPCGRRWPVFPYNDRGALRANVPNRRTIRSERDGRQGVRRGRVCGDRGSGTAAAGVRPADGRVPDAGRGGRRGREGLPG